MAAVLTTKTILENPLNKNTDLTLMEHLHMASHKDMEALLQATPALMDMVPRVDMAPHRLHIILHQEASQYI